MLNKNTLKSYISLLILLLITVVPVFVFYQEISFSNSFAPWPVLFSTLGKLTGLLGLAIFALALLLSSRFVWLDKLFYGLPKVINLHRWFGTLSFTLIIFHPLFLAARLLPVSSQLAFGLFTNWTEAAMVFGYVSLLLFMALIVMTFFWRMRYERLKSLHSLLAVPLMLGGVHSLLIESDVKRSPILAAYYILLISTSVIFYLGRLFLVSRGIKAKPFVVSKVEQLNASIVGLTLKPVKKMIHAKAGQFIFVSFPDIKKGEEHPFSVAQIHPDNSLSIIAKNLGDHTAQWAKLKVGSTTMVDGPFGSFGDSLNLSCHQVWIAGGIGVTPFMSLARSLPDKNNITGVVDLFYIVNSEKDLVGLDAFKKLALDNPQFKLNVYTADNNGRFDIEKLKKFISDLNACHFYICGPAGMMKYFVSALRQAGVPKKNINVEAFQML